MTSDSCDIATTARKPKISVVTISFNQATFLERALESVLNQKGTEIEYIVVDAGSTDGSRQIIERYRPSLDHVILEPDLGPSDGLNKGLALAKAEFFYFLNSDDEVAPGAFSEALVEFARNPDVAVIYGNGLIVDEIGNLVKPAYSPAWMNAELYARGLSSIVQQASFFRTDWVRRVGGFNVANRSCWDGELFFEIARAGGSFKRIWRTWGLFRLYGETITGSGRFAEQFRQEHRRIALSIGAPDPSHHSIITSILYFVTRIADIRRLSAQILFMIKHRRMWRRRLVI